MTAIPRSSWQRSLYYTSQSLINLLFPPSCAGCGSAGTICCDACAQAVQPIDQAICLRCGRVQVRALNTLCSLCVTDKSPTLTLARAAALHTEPLRSIIHQFKYGKHPELAQPLVRYLLATYAAIEWRKVLIDVVVPVPMFEKRQEQRGYNQAELLARLFCQATKLPLAPHLLNRTRFTKAQVGLHAEERRRNVQDAFEATWAAKDKNILLIDDVYTTGATLRACAEAAKNKGASNVYALALAIPVENENSKEDSL